MRSVSFIGHTELVVHRCLWTAVMLFLTTTYLSKWNIFFKEIKKKKKLIGLFISGFLIFINWSIWIYAVASERIIDASFGYFILDLWWGFIGVIYAYYKCIIRLYLIFKEELNKKEFFSIFLVFLSIIVLIFFNLKSLPWVGLIVAFSWAFYNLVRKKILIDTDIGLLIESLYIFPFALVVFYLISKNGLNDFNLENPGLSVYLLLAGPMTVIPLFLYVRGVELIGLGPTGMIFYITPSLQFILGYFYYGEDFSLVKFISFIIIWIAVIIYIKDLYEKN